MIHPKLNGYTIIFSKKADKFLDTLDKKTKLSFLKKVRELQTNSENLNIKKLKSHHKLYRLRIGDFRAVYSIQHERIIIYIVAIGYRKNIYDHLNFA